MCISYVCALRWEAEFLGANHLAFQTSCFCLCPSLWPVVHCDKMLDSTLSVSSWDYKYLPPAWLICFFPCGTGGLNSAPHACMPSYTNWAIFPVLFFCIYLFCVCMCVFMCCNTHVEMGGHLAGVGPLLPPRAFQASVCRFGRKHHRPPSQLTAPPFAHLSFGVPLCCGTFVHCVRIHYCDWLSKELNGQ